MKLQRLSDEQIALLAPNFQRVPVDVSTADKNTTQVGVEENNVNIMSSSSDVSHVNSPTEKNVCT